MRLVPLSVAAILFTAVVFPPAGAAAVSQQEPIETALGLLHDGRFDEADELLSRGSSGDDPIDAFFHAFVTYWRLLYDGKNPAHRALLEKRLGRAISLAEARAKTNPSDPVVGLVAGSAHLLLAQLRAAEKKVLGAAGEARKAKRSLEAALRSDSVAPEASFALGTYNYVADQVPAFVKGLRAILFLPGGDRERGLEQLERAATTSRYFALEARILLSTIYSSRQEKLFREARRQTDLARKIDSGSIAALHASAILELALARPERAASFLDGAADRAAKAGRTDRAVIAAIAYQRARSEFAMLRPDLAQDRLRALLNGPGRLPAALETDAKRLVDLAASITGPGTGRSREGSAPSSPEPSDGNLPGAWDRALPALDLAHTGKTQESIESLLALAEKSPDEPVFGLLAGRSLLLADRPKDALPLLARAARSTRTPAAWQGLAKLFAGFAADRTGKRAEAVELYRKALESPPFIGRDAASFCLQAPCMDPR